MIKKKSKYATLKDLKRNEILALDIAIHCGYYGLEEGGTWDFTESMARNNNKQHQAFRETLIDYIQNHNIKRVVAEDVSVGKSFFSARKLSEFRGILLEVCDTLNLPEPVFLNPTTIKKFATGNGRADKAQMIKACKNRWKINPVDDNHADAVHIFYCFISRFNL